jgi:hypothetical protein
VISIVVPGGRWIALQALLIDAVILGGTHPGGDIPEPQKLG